MRMRKKKHGDERRAALSHLLITADALTPGTARSHVADPTRPLMLEIGCGKGDFVIGMAKRHPEWNFLAMERVPDVILCAMEKCHEAFDGTAPDNVIFCIANANALTDFFAPGEIDGIYLNFSDPWPKAGHKKRRLTHAVFLDVFKQILTSDGSIALKTDNDSLFDFSLEELPQNGFILEDVTRDLHSSIYNSDNVMTEYEANFTKQGIPIKRCVAKLK